MIDRRFDAYRLWLRVHPRYYDKYGYDAWKRFNTFFYDLYDIPYDYHNIYKREINRKKAIRSRVNKYVKGLVDACYPYTRPYLLSLTFTDDVLLSTNFDTRFTYVKRYLNDTFRDYIGCVDFGKLNHREHYHAIVDIGYDAFDVVKINKRGRVFVKIRDKPDWPYGFSTLCPLDADVRRSSNYAFKSSNYAFKSSGDEHKVFHKRGAYRWLQLLDEFDIIANDD